MKIYSMFSTTQSEHSLLDIKDPDGAILDFFLLGMGNKGLENGRALQASAQAFFQEESITDYDYFEPSISLPIFSVLASTCIGEALTAQMSLHPCKTRVGAGSIAMFAGRILNRKPIFERVGDYKIQIRQDADIRQEDLIVRDANMPQFFFVTESFKILCEQRRLKIKFKPFSLMK